MPKIFSGDGKCQTCGCSLALDIHCIVMQAWAAKLKTSGQQLDYAIHSAGVVDDYADLDEVDEERMLHCFRTNTIGPVLTVQALLEQKLLGDKSVLAILTSKVHKFSLSPAS